MNLLIKNANVIDANGKFQGDILIITLGAAAVHLPSGLRRGKAEPHGQHLAPVPVHGHL